MTTSVPFADDELMQLLERFFAAENARDWQAYERFLHPEVDWLLARAGGERRIHGAQAYLAAIRAAYAGTSTRFRCLSMMVAPEHGRVSTLLVDDNGERSLDVFDIDHGLIVREWEFPMGRAHSDLR